MFDLVFEVVKAVEDEETLLIVDTRVEMGTASHFS